MGVVRVSRKIFVDKPAYYTANYGTVLSQPVLLWMPALASPNLDGNHTGSRRLTGSSEM
jgi:hypothetical protein